MNKKIVRDIFQRLKQSVHFVVGVNVNIYLGFRIMYGYIVRRMIFRILMNYTDNSVNQMMLSIII